MKAESQIRPILGAYINLARNNLFTTLKYINAVVGASGGIDDNEAQIYLMSVLKSKLTPEQEDKARRLFFLHFPFLKFLSSDKEDLTVSFSRMRDEIKTCANVLSWWRNIYSHSRAKEEIGAQEYYYLRDDESKVCRLLTLTATASARIIKERYSSKNESQKGLLTDDSMAFINKSRFKPTTGSEGKKKMVLNEKHFLCPIQEGSILPNGKCPDRLSISGKIQLICLFLEKKYITEFISQVQFLSDFCATAPAPRLSQQRLALDTISALRVRLPESRLQPDRDEIQVAMDILSELKKCPSEIYELLSAKDKSTFSVQSSTGESVLLRRSADRFVPLALSFLDTTKAFSKLRFQVNAGTFRYLFKEDKKCVDDLRRMRVLQEPLNGFGRIQEVEALRNADNRQLWKDYKILGSEESARNDKSVLPYISKVYTRYVINGDNIGMRLEGDSLPDVKLKEDGLRYDIQCQQPDCTISRFNLQAMLFYHLLRQMTKDAIPSVEDLVREAVGAYRRFFNDVAEGNLPQSSGADNEERLTKILTDSYGISFRDIPDKLKEYLLSIPDKNDRFGIFKQNLIKEMQEDTQRRLDRIDKQKHTVDANFRPGSKSDNKPGKKSYVQIKPGRLASYLAEDIVLFQDCEDKMTGLNYAVMQGAMATFSSHDPNGRSGLMKLYKNAGLISNGGNAGTHPFLWAVMKEPTVTSTLTLYIKYLRARLDYLTGVVPDSAAFLHSERKRWEERNGTYYMDLANRYLSQPIALAGSVFEAPIRNILINIGNADLKKSINEALSKGRCNVSYMIRLYRQYILDDNPQVFYGLVDGGMEHGHNFRLFGLVRKYPEEASIIKNNLKSGSVFRGILYNAIEWVKSHPEESSQQKKPYVPKPSFDVIQAKISSAYKELTETERLIRRLATQDTLLFMASSSLIKKVLGLPDGDTSMKQDQIGCPESGGILEKRLPKVVNKFSFGWKDSTKNTDPVFWKTAAIEAKDICIKDYGDIFRVINDRRVASLVHHLNISSISVDELRKELDSYDSNRVGVFRDIFEYENKVLAAAPNLPARPTFEEIRNLDEINSSEDKFAAGIIRNSFCHNFYPTRKAGSKEKKLRDVTIIEGSIPEVAESLASKISEFAKKTTK